MQASLKETTILQRPRQEGRSLVSPKPLGAAGDSGLGGGGRGGSEEGSMGVSRTRPLLANEFIITAQENWDVSEKERGNRKVCSPAVLASCARQWMHKSHGSGEREAQRASSGLVKMKRTHKSKASTSAIYD